MNKILSISIAAYNAENFLTKCLDSIVKCRELDKIEVLIVDDGSRDSTKKIAIEYCEKYPQSIFLISKENGGHGSTINAAIRVFTGKYFKTVDSDDWVETDNLDELVSILERADIDIVLNPYYIVNANNLEDKKIVYPCKNHETDENADYTVKEICSQISLQMHSMTLNAKLVREMGPIIDENCFYVDTEYIIFPMLHVEKIKLLNFPIYDYLLGSATQSMNMMNMRKRRDQHYRVTKRLIEFYNHLPDNVGIENKVIIRNRIIGVAISQYVILFTVDGEEGRREIIEFDQWLKKELPEIYKMIPSFADGGYMKVVLFARRTNFIGYSAYRKILKKLHLIKE